METQQIFFYLLVLGIVALYVRRYLRRRSIPQVNPAEIPPGSILLDVRSPAERSQDAIPGSMHIPLHQISRRSDELEKYRDRRIICYCATGNRSLSAAATLKKSGFDAANLVGGIAGWRFTRRR